MTLTMSELNFNCNGKTGAGGKDKEREEAVRVGSGRVAFRSPFLIATSDSVLKGDKIVQAPLSAFGRIDIDIAINNGGTLRDVSFVKMSQVQYQWDTIHTVHRDISRSRTVWDCRPCQLQCSETRFGRPLEYAREGVREEQCLLQRARSYCRPIWLSLLSLHA